MTSFFYNLLLTGVLTLSWNPGFEPNPNPQLPPLKYPTELVIASPDLTAPKWAWQIEATVTNITSTNWVHVTVPATNLFLFYAVEDDYSNYP